MKTPMKECEFCEKEFTPNRIDAKFCGRQCQSTAYNRSKAKSRAYLKLDLPVLEYCRNVLHQLFIDDAVPNNKVPKSVLAEKRFQFGVCTCCYRNKETMQVAYRLFDYVIEAVSDEFYKIYLYEKS